MKVGPGTKLFYSIAALIAIGLFWMKYIEPLCPTTNTLSPIVFQNPYNFLTSLWGALLFWIFVAMLIAKIEIVYERLAGFVLRFRKG